MVTRSRLRLARYREVAPARLFNTPTSAAGSRRRDLVHYKVTKESRRSVAWVFASCRWLGISLFGGDGQRTYLEKSPVYVHRAYRGRRSCQWRPATTTTEVQLA